MAYYNRVYLIDSEFVDGDSIKWKITCNGEMIFATKDGKKYIIKRNLHIRKPEASDSSATKRVKQDLCDKISNKQEEIKKRLKDISVSSDHIVKELDNGFDSENKYYTITELIPNCYPKDTDYSSLTLNEFISICKETANELNKLHARNVIHGDLKEDNIVIAKDSKIPYIIDFDTALLSDNICEPDEMPGTEGYRSLEAEIYYASEDESLKSTITPKIDVFTLALVMHKWWTNDFPSITTSRSSIIEALYNNEPIKIDKKFDKQIGPNKGATFISLMNWMLQKDYNNRPTMEEVYNVLSDKALVDSKYVIGSDVKPFNLVLWKQHEEFATLNNTKIESDFVEFSPANLGGGINGLKYKGKDKSNKDVTYSITDLISKGYATSKGSTAEIWPGHQIEILPQDQLLAKGYILVTKHPYQREKYYVKTIDGFSYAKGKETLIKEGLANPIFREVEVDTPWPEHGSTYDKKSMNDMGVKSITRVEIAGEKRYRVVYYPKTSGGPEKVQENVSANNLKLMGYIK